MDWKGMPNWAELDKRPDFTGATLNEPEVHKMIEELQRDTLLSAHSTEDAIALFDHMVGLGYFVSREA